MSFAKNLLTNKYVLYVVLFLAVMSIFGYISFNNTNAVILFILIGLVARIFTKNMIIILGLSIVITHLMVATKSYKEGLENQEDTNMQKDEKDKKDEKDEKTDTNPNPTYNTATTTSSNPISNLISNPTTTNPNTNPIASLISNTTTQDEPKALNSDKQTTMNSDNKKGFANRIDYASTLEEAYDNLESILGGDGITNLTNDTQKLMSKQQELFKSMESMAPMLNQAKDMLQGFDLKNLQGLAGLASSFTGESDKKK